MQPTPQTPGSTQRTLDGDFVPPEVLDDLLAEVDKPARYTGGELNSVVKGGPVRARMALCFPDVYEVAESHIGLKILYHVVNRAEDFAAERVYAQWPDLEARARAAGVPLWSLETHRALRAFDVVGFTLQYELSYPTIVGMLDHGGITPRAAERGLYEPVVIGGGAGAFNPEPIADFFDAFLLGDGEEAVLAILEVVARARARGASRAELLHDLGALDGVYVPSHYAVEYDGLQVTSITALPGTPKEGVTSRHGTPRVTRTTIDDLDAAPYPTANIVPNVQPIHDRAAIEIQRGCSQACRFCQAGMITRPTRQRRPETVLRLAEESLRSCGADEVGLLSLSAGDYQPINEVLSEFFRRYGAERIGVSLPSMRTETMTPELAEQVATVKKSGFTFAPEAGSERMRNVINKTNAEEDLINAVRATVRAGWRQLKFYFMIGLPTETDDDVDAIALLAERARAAGRAIRKDMNVTVSVSTFVPKPHTAFQWERQISVEETRQKHRRLQERLQRSGIGFKYHSPRQSFLEGVLSRGDRRLAGAIERAAREGSRLDAWSDWYDHDRWVRVLTEELAPFGLTPHDYLRERPEDALLPWDHLDPGILKKFLLRDRRRAYVEGTIDDCAFTDHCYACGGCDLGDPYHAKRKDEQGQRLVQLRPRVFEQTERAPTEPSPEAPTSGPRPSPVPLLDGERVRLRFRYAKLGRAFHLSHLDTKEHVLRAIRLSGLPVIYSQGFTPRPRVSFSPACPTGIASEAEYFDLTCAAPVDVEHARARLGSLLPDGLFLTEAEQLPPQAPGLDESLVAIAYVVSRPPSVTPEAMSAAVDDFRLAASFPVRVVRKKRTKVIDARAQVLDLVAAGDKLHLTLVFAPAGSLKVREAVGAILGPEVALSARIRKVRMDFAASPKAAQPSPWLADGTEPLMDLSAVSTRQQEGSAGPPTRPRAAEPVVIPYAE